MRGISTILNKNEIEKISSYISHNNEWKKLLKFLGMQNICCIVDVNHKFFNIPSKYIGIRHNLIQIRKDINNNINTKYINSPNDNFKYGKLTIKNTTNLLPPNMQIIDNYIKDINYNL
jgi:hypothetical protein